MLIWNYFSILIHFYYFVTLISPRDPWSMDNLYGWIGEYTFQMISGDLYLIISMLFASFFISICLHHRAFSEQFQTLLNQLDISTGVADKKGFQENQQHNRIRILLNGIVQFHILMTE